MAEAIRKIFGEIGFKDKASKDLDKLDKGMDETKESMLGMAQVAGAVVTAAFLALAHASFQAGKELELQVVRLEVLSGDAYPKLEQSMNDAIAASEGLTATGDMSLALNQALKMGASIDVLTGSMAELQKLSFITGDDLAATMKNMSRSIATGSTRFLEQNPILAKNIEGFKALGAGYDNATKKKRELFIVDAFQKNQIKIQEQYNKIIETTAGQLQIVSTQWGNVQETIGGMIMKALKPLIKIGAQVLRFLGETERGIAITKTAFIAFSVAVGIVAVAAFKAMAVAAWAALVPMAPFLLIALAIIAAITTIVLVVDDLITGFEGGESVLFDFFRILLKVHRFIVGKVNKAIDTMVDNVITLINVIKGAGFAIADFFAGPIDSIIEMFDNFVNVLAGIPDRVIGFFRGLGRAIFNFFQGLLPDWAIKLLNKVVDAPAAAPATAAIQGRAAGGPVTAGTPFVVGEDGPEVFVPGNNGSIIPNGAGMGGGRISIKSVVGSLQIIVQNATEAAEEIESVVLDALNNLAENTLAAELGVELS